MVKLIVTLIELLGAMSILARAKILGETQDNWWRHLRMTLLTPTPCKVTIKIQRHIALLDVTKGSMIHNLKKRQLVDLLGLSLGVYWV
jgi:hypothetical protein